jgi:hypothetical protein
LTTHPQWAEMYTELRPHQIWGKYCFKAHTTDKIQRKMSDHGTTHCIIPGGCTFQPLDVSIISLSSSSWKQLYSHCS